MTDSQKIRQLERQLAELEADPNVDIHKKIDILNDLAWALSDIEMKRAYGLAEKAYKLANHSDDGVSPYQVGIAYSLRTQGYLNMRFGDFTQGMSQLLRAQELCESLNLDDALADVFDGIAGINEQIGNFPEALSFIYKQLEIAQRIGDQKRIVNAYNNLATNYYHTGNLNRSIETFQYNLQAAREIKYRRVECISLLNLAEIHIASGDSEKALDFARSGLQIARETRFELFEVYALDHLGEVYLKLGKREEAIPHLENALALSRKTESKVDEVQILLALGEAHRDLGETDRALDFLRRAIGNAASIEAKDELSQGHALLYELYEQKGDLGPALYHLKQHQSIKELLFGEQSDQRWQAEQKLQHQLSYARALSACSQILLSPAESENDYQDLLTQALRRLMEPTQARSIHLSENIEDPKMGFSSRIVCIIYASDSPVQAVEQEGLQNGLNAPEPHIVLLAEQLTTYLQSESIPLTTYRPGFWARLNRRVRALGVRVERKNHRRIIIGMTALLGFYTLLLVALLVWAWLSPAQSDLILSYRGLFPRSPSRRPTCHRVVE